MKKSPAISAPSGRKATTVTTTIILVNLLVFFWQVSIGHGRAIEFQARYALSLASVGGGAWWQLISYQFLHSGLVHLGVNLLFLHSLGPVLEETMGLRKYLALYLSSGVFGGVVHLLAVMASPQFVGDPPVVGASASLCGLLSAICALYAEEKMEVRILFLIPVVLRAKFLLLIVALISIVGMIFPVGNVAHSAHLGGLVGGLLCLNLMHVKPISPGGPR